MKLLQLFALACVILLVIAVPAMAQAPSAGHGSFLEGKAGPAGLGVGLAIIGAGIGFGRIGASALESMARQPEVAGDVRGAMIVIAALLEGATFFGLLICLLCLVL
jgi:F-type H+-transporting ATPase subunit c